MGGPAKLADMLRSDVTQGLPEGDDLEERAKEFGRNWVRQDTRQQTLNGKRRFCTGRAGLYT